MPTGTGSGTGTGGTPAPSSPNWFKRNWVNCAAVAALIGVCVLGFKSCNDDTDERLDRAESNISVLDQRTQTLFANDSVFQARQAALEARMRTAETNITNLQSEVSDLNDSITVHREAIDSLTMRVDSLETRVDTIAARQERCPCINPRAKRPAAQRPERPTRPNNVPARHDTIFVIVKPDSVVTPMQNANGCGDNQNANVVIRGNNNTVNISNNGNNGTVAKSDTTRTVTRRVSASCSSTLVVNTVVTRNSYCK